MAASTSLSDPKLLRWYADYRKRYFTNKLPLPSEMELVFGKIPGEHACCEEDEAGETNIIRVNIAWSFFDDIAAMSLLHEMAHIHINYWKHGKPFQAEMLRLAQLGAFKNLW